MSSLKKTSRDQVSEESRVPIRTSQLVARIDREAFNRRYRMLCVKTSDKWFPHGARILDEPLLSQNKVALSVSFEKNDQFYVLCDNNAQDIAALKETLRTKGDGGEKITVDDVSAEDVDDYVLVRLLFAALSNAGSDEGDEWRFNNLTGHLYCVVPNTIKYEPPRSKTISSVSCIEIKISEKMTLELPVQSFTNLKFKDKIKFGKKASYEYARYVFSEDNCTFRRKLSDDGNDIGCFIARQIKGVKASVPFLCLAPKAFRVCKMGILAVALKRFKEQFGDICTLEFETIENCTSIAKKYSELNENRKAILKLFGEKHTRIVDEIGGADGKRFCDKIKELLKQEYNINASIEKEKREECLNICAIHNRAWYEEHGQEDPHTTSDAVSVQHVTIEDFGGNERAQKAAIKAVAHDLLIKDDLVHNRITLFDWGTLALTEDVIFGLMCYKDDKSDEDNDRKNKEQYFVFMKIAPDGSFTLDRCDERDRFHSEWKECLDALLESKDVLGIIKRSGGINCICNTGLFGVPEIDKIAHELSEGNTYLRGQKKRDELLPSVLDIKSFQKEGCTHYLVGAIGDGMQSSVPNAVNIRRIVPFGDAPLMFDDLLPLMNVTFVHNEQLTVIPFPFKYLREWATKTGGGKQEGKDE